MKKLIELGKPITKKEQSIIKGGHGGVGGFISNAICQAKCYFEFDGCFAACTDIGCRKICEAQVKCCRNECPPDHGELR